MEQDLWVICDVEFDDDTHFGHSDPLSNSPWHIGMAKSILALDNNRVRREDTNKRNWEGTSKRNVAVFILDEILTWASCHIDATM